MRTLQETGELFVKDIASNDTIILTDKPTIDPPIEMRFVLLFLEVSQVANNANDFEDKGGFETREYLRKLLISKCVKYEILKTYDNGSYGGFLYLNNLNILTEIIKNGYGKVKLTDKIDTKNLNLKELSQYQLNAENKKYGINNDDLSDREYTYVNKINDSLFQKLQGKRFYGVVESIEDGCFGVINLVHFNLYIKFHLEGVICNKKNEKYYYEANFFTSIRILKRDVIVTVKGLYTFDTLDVSIDHIKGNITVELLKAGLARISLGYEDEHKLSEAQKVAMGKKLRIWSTETNIKQILSSEDSFKGIPIEIITREKILVSLGNDFKAPQIILTLNSIKTTKPEEGYVDSVKDFLIKTLIGHKVTVIVEDKVKDDSGELSYYGTVLYGNHLNIIDELIKLGYAKPFVLKSSTIKSPNIQHYNTITSKKVYNGNSEKAGIDLLGDSHNRSQSYLDYLQRSGTLTGIVDYCFSISSYKITIKQPKLSFTFSLAGIKGIQHSKVDKSDGLLIPEDPYGDEGYQFVKYNYLQREVTLKIESLSKSRVYIGQIILPDKKLLAHTLLEKGYAQILESSIDYVPNSSTYYDAEYFGQTSRNGIWKVFPEVGVFDAKIININSPTELYIKLEKPEEFYLSEQLMSGYQKSIGLSLSNPLLKPRNQLICLSLYNMKEWRRSCVLTLSSTSLTVLHLDFGTIDTVKSSFIRAITPELYAIPFQCYQITLAGVIGVRESYPFVNKLKNKPCKANILDNYGYAIVMTDNNLIVNESYVEEGWGAFDSDCYEFYPAEFKLWDRLSIHEKECQESEINLYKNPDIFYS